MRPAADTHRGRKCTQTLGSLLLHEWTFPEYILPVIWLALDFTHGFGPIPDLQAHAVPHLCDLQACKVPHLRDLQAREVLELRGRQLVPILIDLLQ